MRLFRPAVMLLAGVALAVGCTGAPEAEGNIAVHDPNQRTEFLKQLDARGVPYRTDSGGWIFYPMTHESSVRAVKEALWGKPDEMKKGVRVNAPQAPDVASKLVTARIQYEVLCDEKACVFSWPAHVDGKASELVREVLKEHGV